MSNSNGVITAPVSVADVQKVLGVSDKHIGDLCKSAKINKWAKYKPISYKALKPITEAQRKTVNFGMSLPAPVEFRQNLNTIKNVCATGWVYDKPTGGINSPCRIDDFNNYYHGAKAPIQVVGRSWEVNKVISKTLTIRVDADPGDSMYELQAYDLIGNKFDLRQAYLYGCIAQGTTVRAWLQAEAPLLDSDGNLGRTWIDYDCTNLNGTYTVYLCLRFDEASYLYLYPLPEDLSNGITLKVTTNPDAGGVGINGLDDVAFAPAFGGTYHTAREATDGGDQTYAMYNDTGDLLVRINFISTSNYATTLKRTDFSWRSYYDGESLSRTTTKMYTSNPTAYDGGVASAVIPAKGSLTLWFYIETLLSNVTATTKDYYTELALLYKDIDIQHHDLYYYRGNGSGWTKR